MHAEVLVIGVGLATKTNCVGHCAGLHVGREAALLFEYLDSPHDAYELKITDCAQLVQPEPMPLRMSWRRGLDGVVRTSPKTLYF